MSDLKFCKALAEVASLAATAREAGMSSFVMKDDLENILQENGSVDFKDSLNEVVDTIYASPAISPERAKNLYLETCMENMLSEPE